MFDFQDYMRDALKEIRFDEQDVSVTLPVYDISEDVKKLVISERDKVGMTQKELSGITKISQANISRIESGQMPSLRTLKKIADAVGKRLVIRFEDFEEVDDGGNYQ